MVNGPRRFPEFMPQGNEYMNPHWATDPAQGQLPAVSNNKKALFNIGKLGSLIPTTESNYTDRFLNDFRFTNESGEPLLHRGGRFSGSNNYFSDDSSIDPSLGKEKWDIPWFKLAGLTGDIFKGAGNFARARATEGETELGYSELENAKREFGQNFLAQAIIRNNEADIRNKFRQETMKPGGYNFEELIPVP